MVVMFSVAQSHYETLGIPKDATPDQIRQAYKRLALKHHPDRNPGDPNAEVLFKEVNTAYQVLSDESKRAAYDAFGSVDQNIRSQNAKSNKQAVNDFFVDYFNNSEFAPFSVPRRKQSTQEVFKREAPGDDITIDIILTLEESISGCKKPIFVR